LSRKEICKEAIKEEKFDFTQKQEIPQLKNTILVKDLSDQKFDRLIIEQNLPVS
jgi:hypothetical protein